LVSKASAAVNIEDFHYDLPQHLIAQFPADERTASRLLCVSPDGVSHDGFANIGAQLEAGDLLVLNNTRVIKARLLGRKDSGGHAEVLVERVVSEHQALCQVRVSKPLKVGRSIQVGEYVLQLKERQGQFFLLDFSAAVLQVLETCGHVPLPPYIQRGDDDSLDTERYQTIFGTQPGAVAAPTAGLHFSHALIDELELRGILLAKVTLHVGAGTFQPVRGDLANHVMHKEWFEVSEQAIRSIQSVKARGGRVIAVGTTVARALESAFDDTQQALQPCLGDTQLFITPGFKFNVVDALITNFHLPGSTLMMLVCAFAGYHRVMAAYRVAVEHEYRFFSYGDAMFLHKDHLETVDV